MALIRLIDLTASVRTSTQSGLRRKVPRLIKKELDKYLNWAAQDGGYHHLRIVPNIITEIIDSNMTGDDITQFMQNRMRALARLQCEFLRADRDAHFWQIVKPSLLHSPKIKVEDENSSPLLRGWSSPIQEGLDSQHSQDELSTDGLGFDGIKIKTEVGTKRKRIVHSPRGRDDTSVDELVADDYKGQAKQKRPRKSTPSDNLVQHRGEKQAPHTPTKDHRQKTQETTPENSVNLVHYRRPPSVVYGLFILNTTVFVLTVDAAKGDTGYVSFHVETDFQDKHQSVWNALTIAIATCMARDELRTRLEDFEPLPIEVDSDPDA